VDRQKAANMQLTVSNIAKMLETILSGTEAGYYRESGKEYTIRVKLKDAEKRNSKTYWICRFPMRAANRSFCAMWWTSGPVRPHPGRTQGPGADYRNFRNISGRDLGSILTDIRERLRSIPIPRDFSIVFGGDYEEQQKSFRELLLGFVLSIVLIYMVMASLFESLRDPFIVMFAVPMAPSGDFNAPVDKYHFQCPVLYRLHHAGGHCGQQRHPAGGSYQSFAPPRRDGS
jgi:HAE1 family hydrophobic/amphiphilic exporter-1